jgi:hypothetical protein
MEAGHALPQRSLDTARQAAGPAWQHAARAFGRASGDLDIRLDDADRPAVVTRVLAACLDGFADREVAESMVWEWTLAERLQGLLAIVIAGGTTPPPWHTRCDRCAVAIEIDVPPLAFVEPPRRGRVACRSPDGHAVSARLPRGNDARAWRANVADARVMATNLIDDVDGEAPAPGWLMPPAWLDPLAEALAESDPLTVLQLHAGCPNCGHLNIIDFDLEAWLLGLFADEQQHLIDDVHRLARFYHWSEAAICALPQWRRRAYLARIEREAEA